MYVMQPGDTRDQSRRCRLTESHPSEPEIKARFDEILGKANSMPFPLTNQPLMHPSPLTVTSVRLASSFTSVSF